MKDYFCTHCGRYVHTNTVKKPETYHVLNKLDVTVEATVRVCNECSREVFDEYLDDKTLKLAYKEYERITGEKVHQ